MIFLRCLIVALALAYCVPTMAQHTHPCGHGNQPPCPPPPPPPPTPASVTLSPATQTIPSTDTANTVIGSVAVSMTDGSAFSGTFSVTPNTFLAIANNQQILNRNFSAADAGTNVFTVTATQNNASAAAQATIIVTAPPPPPTLTLTFAPQMPSIPDTTSLGAVVATVTAAWSDGSAFTGTLMFGSPHGDDNGTFALSCMQCATANIVVNPVGLGVMGDGGTVQNVSVVATQ